MTSKHAPCRHVFTPAVQAAVAAASWWRRWPCSPVAAAPSSSAAAAARWRRGRPSTAVATISEASRRQHLGSPSRPVRSASTACWLDGTASTRPLCSWDRTPTISTYYTSTNWQELPTLTVSYSPFTCKCKIIRSSTKVLRGVRIGLCEEMGFQLSSKLSTTNGWWAELWWKHVPDGWGCNVETLSAELCSCRRDKHVVAFCRTEICPTRNAGDWDVVEV